MHALNEMSEAQTFAAWLWTCGITRRTSDSSPCLGLQHLSRAHLSLLCAHEGIPVSDSRAQLLAKLTAKLSAGLDEDNVKSSLPGLVPACEYPSVVRVPQRYELLLFGGSQQGIADTSRAQAGSSVANDSLWRCNLLGGEWRSVSTEGVTPGARSGHTAIVHDGKMWVYGGWNDPKGEAFGDMHVLHIRDGNRMRWEEVEQKGFFMEPRAWHSVCVHNDHMLLYGDNGDCDQSQAQLARIYSFCFATSTWQAIPCKGKQHPSPQSVLALAVHGNCMLALCFTEPAGRPRLHSSPLDAAALEAADDAEELASPRQPPFTPPAPGDDSVMEVFQLDLATHTWSRLSTQGQVPPGRYGCSATVSSDGASWIIHGGISKNHGCPIFSDTFSFDFCSRTWTELVCEDPDVCIPRTGHVGIAVDETIVFVGGNSCMQPESFRNNWDVSRRAGASVNSHGLYFPIGASLGPLYGHMPNAYRGDDHVTYCTVAQVLWKRKREVLESADESVCNIDLLEGLRRLGRSAGGESPSGQLEGDIVIVCSDGARLPAYRALLAASAESFCAMFKHSMQESTSGVLHMDASSEHVQALLDYIHGNLTSIEVDLAKPLFQLADRYGLRGLMAACIASLKRNLSVALLPDLVALSDAHSCQELMDACVAFASVHAGGLAEIIGSPAFATLMAERPCKTQAFLLACIQHNGPKAEFEGRPRHGKEAR